MKIRLTLGIIGLSMCSVAQTDAQLNDVEVISQKSASELFTAQRVEVLTEEDIANTPVKSVNELLEYASALDVRQRGPFDVQSDISVRGGSFDQTLILLNGIPMNDPQTGHHNMNLPINIDDIEKVEILQGGGSHRYGPYAFSGAINIITKSTTESTASVNVEAGQYDYYGVTAAGSYAKNGFGARASVNHAQSSGYLNNTDFNRQNAQLELSYTKNNLKLSIDGGVNDKGFGAQTFYSSAYPDQYEATRTYFASMRATTRINNTIINANAYTRVHTDRFELYRETGDGWYEYTENVGYIRGTDTAAFWYAGPNFHKTFVNGGEASALFNSAIGSTQVGIDIRNESILSNNLGTALDEVIAVNGTRFNYTLGDDRTNSGAFVHHSFNAGRFGAGLSLRYNYNTAFGTDWLPGIEVTYQATEASKVFASANRSFRLPTFTDLYYRLGGAQGSIDLKPEYSNNFELGYTYNSGIVSTTVSGFLRDGENMIDWIVLPDDTTQTLQAQNITALTIYGVDADVRINLSEQTKGYVESVRFSGAWYNSATDEFDFESLYVLDFLKTKFSMAVVHKLPYNFSFSWQISHQQRNGEYMDFSTGVATPFDDVLLIDARLAWTKTNYSIYVDGNNLLDQVYQDRGNVIQPGMWLRAGATWNMTF